MSSSTSSVFDRLPFPLTHGYILSKSHPNLPLTRCTFDGTNQLSRPDMKNNSGVTKSEFQDSLEVLSLKADIFINMFLKKSTNFSILMGAGISAPLINDYASVNKAPAQRLTVEFCNSLRPTPAHRVLAALVNNGHMKLLDVLQQNHDGLLNLAGLGKNLPGGVKGKINEIHGAWKDKTRPVIPMDGSLPGDLFQRMLDQEQKQDCCFTIGTSLSGLNADRLIATANKKGCNPTKYPNQLGGIILSIQQVPKSYEDGCALRIYSTCDRWMLLLAAKLKIDIDWDTDFDYDSEQPIKYDPSKRHRTTSEGIEMLKQLNHFLYGEKKTDVSAAATNPSLSIPHSIISTSATASSSSAAPVSSTARHFTITVGNYHKLLTSSSDSDQNSHKWTVFVRSSEPNIIKNVTFHLHPTFNPPSVLVDTKSPSSSSSHSEEFALTRTGWGTFEVTCEVEFLPSVLDLNAVRSDTSSFSKSKINNNALIFTHMLQFQHEEQGAAVYQQ